MPLIIALVAVTVFSVIVALQNAALVTVKFLGWQFENTLATMILLSFALGAIAGLLVALRFMVNKNRAPSAVRQ
ncbi:MAG: hypothetical protein A2268_13865 [Candidatus Raymondbacteria bacterium RifOxyA12_full_50_37]|uniref:Lipopolysaccharide assembly protein A domain-containing protein n=1 Tax=Candidatus Raymondbacteria bacterium RIFOXYD12_FULL_49_13 TaxID=1817890 RepID=A0A1F7F4S5_UNCRA|nr:MAG: hypothetical protein A2248_00795 [Candidatus Raymondbacteria bacterium RIFOXYA2_FULL_49_16]OGJ91929.1 MAG: hypothetical protein A2268_13865 [Candidatus Raymondbacteria bacterium RifOxyA12_full_50_37]OGJ92844.1 MAG: hypothetical protein A2487_09735 [Candidatus Raymondbacteria bacterium RifOxyC12_full_50_8]OGJ95475.1 MAG: hypothetical protein A2453_05300 [Candidatus Raymondbacteria bacterium RIFOXYC2_FULL_50_21]OGK01631.1 MAG: hypothetical protein A2519_07305 [Candidatus Raymondbacteria b